ncbi:MAG: hypothetical protein JWN49_383 [Parcubacteria group bacterium]|nr:hypothetical protein [Parcubacteria group bacterium]
MEGVSFEEEKIVARQSFGPSKKSPGFADRMVNWGVVKTARQGEVVLLIIAVVALLAAGTIYFSKLRAAPAPQTPQSKGWPR